MISGVIKLPNKTFKWDADNAPLNLKVQLVVQLKLSNKVLKCTLLGGIMKKKTRARFSAESSKRRNWLLIKIIQSESGNKRWVSVSPQWTSGFDNYERNDQAGQITSATPMTPDQRKIKESKNVSMYVELEKEILKKATALLMSDSMRNLR